MITTAYNWPSLSLVRRRRGLSSFRLQDLVSFFKSASVNLLAAVKSEAWKNHILDALEENIKIRYKKMSISANVANIRGKKYFVY